MARPYNPSVNAETAYLFRHALLRDASYQLQLPGDRAKLHALAFEIIEQLHGGRGPEPFPLSQRAGRRVEPHVIDEAAAELSEHARLASEVETGAMHDLRRLYLRRAAEYADSRYQLAHARELWQQLAALLEGAEAGEALRHAGVLCSQLGDARCAETCFQQALGCHRESRDVKGEGATLSNMCAMFQRTGRTAEAMATLQQALSILEGADCRRELGIALGSLAAILDQSGKRAEAMQVFERALALQRECGDARGEAGTLGNLAICLHESDRCRDAEPVYLRAYAMHLANGDRRMSGVILGNLASLYVELGRKDEASRTYEQALAIHREVGNRLHEGVVLGNLASRLREAGKLAESADYFERALSIHRELNHRRFLGIHLCNYGLLLRVRGRQQAAQDTWQEGARVLRDLGDSLELKRQREHMHGQCREAGVPPLDESEEENS